MKYLHYSIRFIVVFTVISVSAQVKKVGHTNENPFRQMYDVFATPNQYRTASGAPGPAYYQNTADYSMHIRLDDEHQRLYGYETITYTNNSPNDLWYLWLQLDQNVRAKDSKAPLRNSDQLLPVVSPEEYVSNYMQTATFDGGFNIESVTGYGKNISYTINQTMMRINLDQPLKPGASFKFSISWGYNINNYLKNGGRSGYEPFENGNNIYVIAQFFPRMCVYNDVEGWQNYPFWGDGEFALPFGNYTVKITVPSDHIVGATGTLQNRANVYSPTMLKRYEKAKKSFDEPVLIVTQKEAEKNEKKASKDTKTWVYKAKMVRDFAFASSRKFMVDMMNVKIENREVMAISMYPPEGNPLWGEYSTRTVAHTLKSYSDYTFPYPYPKAISVNAKDQGMEYPMICWNHSRPKADGTYSAQTKFAMIGVIIHEVGHNFFPMIVNSDERQWGWMDEGLNTFLEYLTQVSLGEEYPGIIAPLKSYPIDRGKPTQIISYMSGQQNYLEPIMTNPEQIYDLGGNAYSKVTTALSVLRETIMGPALFDHAFKTYARRWKFKHPTPEDFFRTMEDASGMDLDWFWRGWFYSTAYVDMGVAEVKAYVATNTPTERGKKLLKYYGIENPEQNEKTKGSVYFKALNTAESSSASNDSFGNLPALADYLKEHFSAKAQREMQKPIYFYQVTFESPGGLVMPLIVEYTYEDGSVKRVKYPVQVWRKNDKQVVKVISSEQKIKKIVVDPNMMTTDIRLDNNYWKSN